MKKQKGMIMEKKEKTQTGGSNPEWLKYSVMESGKKCDEIVKGYCKRFKKNGKCPGCPIGELMELVKSKCKITSTCKEIAAHCTIANILKTSLIEGVEQ